MSWTSAKVGTAPNRVVEHSPGPNPIACFSKERAVMKLTDDFWSRVDQTGDCWVWKSAKTQSHYGRYITENGRHAAAHRLSWEDSNGPIPTGMFIDHICHTHACVRPDHLRLATPKQNLENRAGLQSTNTSGYRGVVWNKKAGFWQAVVVHHYHRHFLGFFHTAEEADAAARAKRLELYTHNNLAQDLGTKFVPTPPCGAATKRGGSCVHPGHYEGRCHHHLGHERLNAEEQK